MHTFAQKYRARQGESHYTVAPGSSVYIILPGPSLVAQKIGKGSVKKLDIAVVAIDHWCQRCQRGVYICIVHGKHVSALRNLQGARYGEHSPGQDEEGGIFIFHVRKDMEIQSVKLGKGF